MGAGPPPPRAAAPPPPPRPRWPAPPAPPPRWPPLLHRPARPPAARRCARGRRPGSGRRMPPPPGLSRSSGPTPTWWRMNWGAGGPGSDRSMGEGQPGPAHMPPEGPIEGAVRHFALACVPHIGARAHRPAQARQAAARLQSRAAGRLARPRASLRVGRTVAEAAKAPLGAAPLRGGRRRGGGGAPPAPPTAAVRSVLRLAAVLGWPQEWFQGRLWWCCRVGQGLGAGRPEAAPLGEPTRASGWVGRGENG